MLWAEAMTNPELFGAPSQPPPNPMMGMMGGMMGMPLAKDLAPLEVWPGWAPLCAQESECS